MSKRTIAVELTAEENALLKAGMMVFLGAHNGDKGMILAGLVGGQSFVEKMGPEGFEAFTAKMDAHKNAHIEAERVDAGIADLTGGK